MAMGSDNSAGLLDTGILASLLGGDAGLQREILQEFCNSAGGYSEALEKAYHGHAFDDLKNVAHKLKSSARTVGAMQLGELCERLEVAGRERNWQRVEACYPAIKPALAAVSGFIESDLL